MKTYEIYVKRINKIKANYSNNDIELASTMSEAFSHLSKKEFREFLKDERVGYKPTQAKKYIKYHEGINGQTSDLVKKIGVEKYYVISLIDNEETKNNLLSFADKNNISFRTLGKMSKIISQNNDLALNEVYEQAKIPKKREKKPQDLNNNQDYVPRQEFEALKTAYDNLIKEFEKLKQQSSSNTLPVVARKTLI